MIGAGKVPCIVLVCLVVATSALWISTAKAQEADYRDVYDYYKDKMRRGPVPGRIIVSVSQSPQQADLFSMQDNRVVLKGAKETNSRLSHYRVERAYKAFHVHGNAVYVLTFADYGNEREIIRYLESLPGVQYAEQDYYLELLAEPNDRYYASSTANWWVPDDIESGATPARVPYGCPTNPSYAYWALPDTSELDDQWYLKHIQANKAWDIERGDTTVKVMVMDSGIDIWHQDLYANIWKNPADLQGDMSGDGLPGNKAQGDIDGDGGMHFNDPDVRTKDFNKNCIALFGADSTCDAGPDGDYGFGPNAIDDPPAGPGGGDDDTLVAGPRNDPWDDNLRGPGCLNPEFDDDMWEVQFLKNDDDENGYPDDHYGFNFVKPDSVPSEQECPVEGCHGTEMAGIIGAVTNNGEGIAGVMWNCRLVSGKIARGVPENGGDANIPRIAEALYYAVDNDIDVVNMSLGYETGDTMANYNSPTIQQAVNYAYDRGVIVLAGAGNRSHGNYWYPASLNHVISVSGTNRFDKKASYTEHNDKVDVCAPVAEIYPGGINAERGEDCVSTGFSMWPYPMYSLPDAELPHDYVVTRLQTSGATAQASGLAGLLVSLYPKSLIQDIMGAQYTPAKYVDFIEAEMKRGCVPISGADSTELGAGRINAYRSLTQWGLLAVTSNDTTWANSVYVSGDIYIGAGHTLTIEPGTTVYFAPDDNQEHLGDSARIQFHIWGTLNANGTAQNPIVFKSMAEEPQPGAWGGIYFKGESSSGSLSHCIIQDAEYGVESAVTIHMSNCEIENCEVAGIYMYDNMDSTSVVNNLSTISDCAVHFNGEDADGMRIWNCPDTISVDSCTVAYNNACGIWVSNACPKITRCEINYNMSQGIWVTSYRYPSPYPYPDVEWCHMHGNGAEGIKCEYNAADISYSKSWQNGTYGLLATGADAYPSMDHSKVMDNPSAGVRVNSGAHVVLGIAGVGSTGYNSIYGSQAKNVYNATTTPVYAQNCWWGSNPPNTSKFQGQVVYTPYLTGDPVAYLAPAMGKMPTVLSLDQNFPNPFSGATGATTIKYSIPGETGKAVLQVYDVLGRRVRTLVNKPHHPGSYYVKWDGRNDRGVRVAPGVYFYQLNVGKQSFTKKIVLAR